MIEMIVTSFILLAVGIAAGFMLGHSSGERKLRASHKVDKQIYLNKIENIQYLWKKGWRYHTGTLVKAPDETKSRDIYDAVRRQRKIDELERLNIPERLLASVESGYEEYTEYPEYQVGDWK